jgi:hypothetical protein
MRDEEPADDNSNTSDQSDSNSGWNLPELDDETHKKSYGEDVPEGQDKDYRSGKE